MTHDVLIVGGGLAGSLASWRLAARDGPLRICVVEGGSTLGAAHTWSFHDTDVPGNVRRWLEPFVVTRWPGHEVRFPDGTRLLSGGYSSITSDRLHDVVASRLGDRLRLNSRVETVTRNSVTLTTGEVIRARLILDARGESSLAVPCGWQTFLGQELELARDHEVHHPVLMDATVPQVAGFRFMYLLPWSPRRLLVEDTLYGDDPSIDADDRRRRIGEYARQRGWSVRAVIREERGALPIPLSGSPSAFWPDQTIRIGVRAGLFHPTTGYSLPDAAAVADLLTRLDLADADAVYLAINRLAHRLWRRRAFFRLLNRMLFRATAPEARVQIMQQFYRRPEPLIARFYAGRLTWLDRCRILAGRPPIPVTRAVAQLRATS